MKSSSHLGYPTKVIRILESLFCNL